MTFEHLIAFDKDLKFLQKKYRTLTQDLEIVKLILKAKPEARPPFSFQLDNLGKENIVIKVKKMACKALKGRGVNSGLRLIYAYFKNEQKIVFIELYHKSDKELEDKERILVWISIN